MIEHINIEIKIHGKEHVLQTLSDATEPDNQKLPTGIKLHQHVNKFLHFSLSTYFEDEIKQLLTTKNTITDYIFHLRVVLNILKVVCARLE